MNDLNYLNELEVRDPKDNAVESDMQNLQAVIKSEIPPIIKLFHQTYNCERNVSSCVIKHMHFNPKFDGIRSFFRVTVFDKNYGLDGSIDYFMSIQTSIKAFMNYTEFDLQSKQVFPIIKCSNTVIINVGYGQENRDKIILLDVEEENGSNFRVLSDNIFTFLRGVTLKDRDIPNQIKSRLYLNWNDDYWRLRDE